MSLTPTQRADLKAARATRRRLTPQAEALDDKCRAISADMREIGLSRNEGIMPMDVAQPKFMALMHERRELREALAPLNTAIHTADQEIEYLTSDEYAAERAEAEQLRRTAEYVDRSWDECGGRPSL